MTPKMLAALSAAEAAEPKGGLVYTAGGFADPTASFEVHSWLWRYGKNRSRRLSITERGETALREARDG